MKNLAKLSIKQKRLLIAAVTTVTVAVVAVIAVNLYIDRYLAITMRLQHLVGDVVLYDDIGNELTLKKNVTCFGTERKYCRRESYYGIP